MNTANLIDFSFDTGKKVLELKKYLFKNLYRSREINLMRSEAEGVLKVLFDHFFNNLDDIPKFFSENNYYSRVKSSRHRNLNLVGDFIGSMTDKEALETFNTIRTKTR
jgi:dGTP triphosphohydrolase